MFYSISKKIVQRFDNIFKIVVFICGKCVYILSKIISFCERKLIISIFQSTDLPSLNLALNRYIYLFLVAKNLVLR